MADNNFLFDEESHFFPNFVDLEPVISTKRNFCDRCGRPTTVCWCPFLPIEPIDVNAAIYIFQHPSEEGRPLKTSTILKSCLKDGQCRIIKGKRFNRNPDLDELVKSPNTILLYPGPDAEDLESVSIPNEMYNLVLLDGTWPQAQSIYHQNKAFHQMKQVKLSNTGLSEYIIRTQPTDGSLSTLETAAVAMSIIENKSTIKEILMKPLRALCDFQLQHGAVQHQSKQYLIDNGLYQKQLPKAKRKEHCDAKNNTSISHAPKDILE